MDARIVGWMNKMNCLCVNRLFCPREKKYISAVHSLTDTDGEERERENRIDSLLRDHRSICTGLYDKKYRAAINQSKRL